MVIALAAGWLVWRYTKFRPRFTVAGKSFLAAIVMAIFMLGWQKMLDSHVLVTAFLAVIIYFPVLYLLGGIKKQDLLQLKNKILYDRAALEQWFKDHDIDLKLVKGGFLLQDADRMPVLLRHMNTLVPVQMQSLRRTRTAHSDNR